ncbi:retrotransposon protein, putative, ty1-copia subclass, partial [Tanacetum coccineum]
VFNKLRADLFLRFFVRSIGVTVNHGIAPAAIIDRQLPFEYTITSRSTDVVVMALPVQNINHSAFRSMFEREKLSGTNFNDWLRRLNTKRAKHNLDSTYLCHCCLAHISKKHIEKLQQEGLLRSTDDELFDQCVSCLSGKMTRKLFPHRPERVTDLLGIIHTDE